MTTEEDLREIQSLYDGMAKKLEDLKLYIEGLKGNIVQSRTAKQQLIIESASEANEISVYLLLKNTRERPSVQARQFVCKYLREHTELSLTSISHVVNRKDHSNILTGIRQINDLLKFDKPTKARYKLFLEILDEKLNSKN